MIAVFVRQSVSHPAQVGFIVQESFGAAFAKSLSLLRIITKVVHKVHNKN